MGEAAAAAAAAAGRTKGGTVPPHPSFPLPKPRTVCLLSLPPFSTTTTTTTTLDKHFHLAVGLVFA